MNSMSITIKLILVIISSFIITTISILFVANLQLTQIIDRSQNAVYTEKVDAIWETLKRSESRLQMTGLVEAYEEHFKELAITALRETYYRQKEMPIFPFIIDTNFKTIMHPEIPRGALTFQEYKDRDVLLTSKNGDFTYTYLNKKIWCIYKWFPAWNWIIVYVVPLNIKYNDAKILLRMLIYLMVGITIAVLLILSIVITKFTNPIINLTHISTQIADGNLDQNINLGSKDEVGVLARSFVRMRDAIKEQIAELNTEIRERKRAEEELKKARNYIANIINSMPSVLVGVNPDGIITQWNLGAEKATGLTSGDAVGQHLKTAIPRLSVEMDKVHKAIFERQEQIDPKKPHQKEGKTVYEDITIYPLTVDGVEGAVIRIDDVTERVQMEEIMIQSEKMLSVGGLAAGIAHEINNPLAGIMQTANVMANRLVNNLATPANITAAESAGTTILVIQKFMKKRGILRMINTIKDSGHRVASIVNNMLSFARKSDTRIVYENIPKLLDKTLELAATDYNLKKHYDFKQIQIIKNNKNNLPTVPCEASKIQQVLLNILRNGAQAMQQAKVKNPQFSIQIALENEKEMISIKIKDNGPGMDEETRKRVFEPFYTTKPVGMGTGLGLSVSYFIITENHKGEMAVESVPGDGTTVIIRLPLKEKNK